MVIGPCYILQRLNGAKIAIQIPRKSDHGAAEDARDRKVQGYSHIFALTIQDTKWYHVLEMMFWQIGTPNKAWCHEVCPRQIQSSFQRRHGSRDFHIWLSLISGLCVDEISYTETNRMVFMTQVREFIHLRNKLATGVIGPSSVSTVSMRNGPGYQNGWIFGKVSKGLWPSLSLIFEKL